MKMLWAIVALFSTTVVLSGPAWSNDKPVKDEVKETIEMAAAAKVTIDEAIKTASARVGGKVVEAELEKKYNKVIWEVEVVTADNKLMEVHIDAETGTVIEVEEERAVKDMTRERKQERKREHKE
mgnify:CR=1 FL=1